MHTHYVKSGAIVDLHDVHSIYAICVFTQFATHEAHPSSQQWFLVFESLVAEGVCQDPPHSSMIHIARSKDTWDSFRWIHVEDLVLAWLDLAMFSETIYFSPRLSAIRKGQLARPNPDDIAILSMKLGMDLAFDTSGLGDKSWYVGQRPKRRSGKLAKWTKKDVVDRSAYEVESTKYCQPRPQRDCIGDSGQGPRHVYLQS